MLQSLPFLRYADICRVMTSTVKYHPHEASEDGNREQLHNKNHYLLVSDLLLHPGGITYSRDDDDPVVPAECLENGPANPYAQGDDE